MTYFTFNFENNNMAQSLLEQENVNGIKLTLKVDNIHSAPIAKQFTISFTNNDHNSSSLISIFAAIFCIIALFHYSINVTILSVIIAVSLLFTYFWVTYNVHSERLLIIPTVGVQSSVQYKTHESHLDFVPWSHIDDIVIIEVITMWRVLSYLTILVKQNEFSTGDLKDMKLIPLFKITTPRLRILERMYSDIQKLLVYTQEDIATGAGDRA